MKPAPFQYHRPESLDQALGLLETLPNARALSGGQSLMPMMNMRVAQADHLVDLNGICELPGIATEGTRIRIGAMTRQRDLLASEVLRDLCPILPHAVSFVGHLQTRNRGTIGGSLGHLDPAAELPGICALHDAELTIASSSGLRRVPMADFSLGFMTPDLQEGEIITEIALETWPRGHGWDFREHAQRHGDFAVVGVASLMTLDAAKITRAAIVLIGVGESPVRLQDAEAMLAGQAPDPDLFAAVGTMARKIPMLSDHLVTEGFRQHLADVLVRRSLAAAVERARG